MKRTFTSFAALVAFVHARPVAVWHVMVLHDDDAGCTPSVCRCEPLYELRHGTAENFADGARRGAEWFRKVAS